MADINAQQIRKIYAIGNALGIVERGNEDDDLHALVSALTGKDSVKALTYTEAQAVIADLQKRQGAAPLPRHKPKTHPERPAGPQTASSARCGRSCISWPRRIRSRARPPWVSGCAASSARS